MEQTIQRRVVCAANRGCNGRIVIGLRHFDDFMRMSVAQDEYDFFFGYGSGPIEQGFVDQRGVFMNRTEAWQVAEAAGQIIRRVGGDTANGGTLYSENLY